MTGPEIDDLWKEIVERNGIEGIPSNRIVEMIDTLIRSNEQLSQNLGEITRDRNKWRTAETNLRANLDALRGNPHEQQRVQIEGLSDYRKASDAIGAEYLKAVQKFPTFASPHEGYAILLEEVHELWDEVRLKEGARAKMCLEAKQVAAMGLRFMVDCAPAEPRHPED